LKAENLMGYLLIEVIKTPASKKNHGLLCRAREDSTWKKGLKGKILQPVTPVTLSKGKQKAFGETYERQALLGYLFLYQTISAGKTHEVRKPKPRRNGERGGKVENPT